MCPRSPPGSRTHEIALTSPVPNTWVSQAGPKSRHNPPDLRISCTPWSVFQDGAQSNDSSPVTLAQNLDTASKDAMLPAVPHPTPQTESNGEETEHTLNSTTQLERLARPPSRGDCTYPSWTSCHPTHLKDDQDHGKELYVTLGTLELPQGLPPHHRWYRSQSLPD